MKKWKFSWQLVVYDLFLLLLVDIVLLGFYRSNESLDAYGVTYQTLLTILCVFSARFIGRIYQQIWRYGGIQCYIRLLIVDGFAFLVNLLLENVLPIPHVAFSRLLAISCTNLLAALAMRMMYRYAYKCGNSSTVTGRFLNLLLHAFAGTRIELQKHTEGNTTKIAIIGAGRVGVALAEELLSNEASTYAPRCFVDINADKVGRSIHGIPVLLENEATFAQLKEYEVQEVVLAIPNLEEAGKKRLFDRYSQAGYKINVYDYPGIQTEGGKRLLRQFDVNDLLFRTPVRMENDKTGLYYRDKVILLTGGGGSIGSELCRQLAKMEPKQIILLDICENGVYDVQQELRIAMGNRLDLRIEIVSITNKAGLRRVFAAYYPQIVINAAAHKHVPLMERNCIEAVENNVFGTQNLVELCEEFGVERFMMVSTDKAVNPTNVMGATKRMCEMIVMSAGVTGKVRYSATRFGNVLGSAGSVIPLFRKQIANGGPITITDKRIVRYFMTIPEASQLVLESGAMAKNGELFVLDMGQPVKILDLAEHMIRLSGSRNIEIVEVGLRPGEKLYEELLVKTEELDKTENSLIFIEREEPLPWAQVEEKLSILHRACQSGDDEQVRAALKQVIPTYKTPEEVNANAEQAAEMQNRKAPATMN